MIPVRTKRSQGLHPARGRRSAVLRDALEVLS